MRAADLIHGPMETDLAEDEIIVAIRFPGWPADRRWGFDEFALRDGDLAIAAVAVFHDLDGPRMANAHVAVMGATDMPQRVAAAEDVLNGAEPTEDVFTAAGAAAAAAIEPMEDIQASAAYRRSLVATLLQRALRAANTRQPGIAA